MVIAPLKGNVILTNIRIPLDYQNPEKPWNNRFWPMAHMKEAHSSIPIHDS